MLSLILSQKSVLWNNVKVYRQLSDKARNARAKGTMGRVTSVVPRIADGSSSPILGTTKVPSIGLELPSAILGTTEVTLRIGAFRTRVSCFVTELSIDFDDIVLGNTFMTEYKAVQVSR